MRTNLIALYGVSLSLLAGCATNEWIQTNRECWAEAYAAFPEKFETRIVKRSELVEVPDGTISCTTRNTIYGAITECRQGTKLVSQQFNETISIDLNEASRANYANSCTVNLCIRRYGNADCEP